MSIPASEPQIRWETGGKRVRVVFNGQVVADSTAPLLVWEIPHYPTYYIPTEDVAAGVLRSADGGEQPPDGGPHTIGLGRGRGCTVRVGTREVPGGAVRYEQSAVPGLPDVVRFEWSAMDAWFEEDEQVYTHPRDPYKRIDILDSSRQVRIDVDGVTVAESSRPRLLFETGLPTRYYLPRTDLRLELLVPSGTVTHCPYKGQAEYWSVRVGERVHDDVLWSYPTPLPESQKITGLVACHPARAELFVDGVRQPRA